MFEKFKPSSREELESGQLSDVAPVLSVGCERKDGMVVSHVLAYCYARPGCENPVVGGEALLHHLPAADHQGSVLANPEGVDWSMFVGHSTEDSDYRDVASEKMEVTNNWQST